MKSRAFKSARRELLRRWVEARNARRTWSHLAARALIAKDKETADSFMGEAAWYQRQGREVAEQRMKLMTATPRLLRWEVCWGCEPGEVLKGALLEAGAALAAGKQVRCVGRCESISRVFRWHPLWSEYPSVEAAVRHNDKHERRA